MKNSVGNYPIEFEDCFKEEQTEVTAEHKKKLRARALQWCGSLAVCRAGQLSAYRVPQGSVRKKRLQIWYVSPFAALLLIVVTADASVL